MKKSVRYIPLLSALFLSYALPMHAEEKPATPAAPAGGAAPEQMPKEEAKPEAKKPAKEKKRAHKKTRAHKPMHKKTEKPAETAPAAPATESPE